MSMTTTYQSLHTDSFMNITIDYSLIKQNFKTLDTFMKNFSTFQRKFQEIQKNQKNIIQQVSVLKMNTQMQISTINGILQSRNQITQGKSSSANEQLNQIRKSIKQLKSFITQSTRLEHQAQQIRQKEQSKLDNKLKQQIKLLKENLVQQNMSIKQISSQIHEITQVCAKKTQISQLSFNFSLMNQRLIQCTQKSEKIAKMLEKTKVQQFKQIIDKIAQQSTNQLGQMKIKFNTKADISDILKLQQMLLNSIDLSYKNSIKSFANKSQTKKSLIFFQKRLNSMLSTILGQDQLERQAILTTKQLKCISCTKDLGEVEGKLDRFKAWSVFPVKQTNIKDKYSGFGAGFQAIVQSTVINKGGQIVLDDKGRMVAPFNLTSTLQGSFMKSSKSQHKIITDADKSKFNISPNKSSLKHETNFMHQFGKGNNQLDFNPIQYYYNEQKGIEQYMRSSNTKYEISKK